MPIYNDPVKGISRSQAIEEAAGVAPAYRAMLATFEIRHNDVVYARVVNNFESINATLEDDAPVDAGQEVTFDAGHVTVGVAEESDQAPTGEVQLSVQNVSGLYKELCDQVRGSLLPIYVTQRLYASDDLRGPAILPPTTLIISRSELDGSSITMTVSYGDPANTAVPRETFNRDDYPGLVR